MTAKEREEAELLLVVNALLTHGLSKEYAAVVAERIMGEGPLNDGDEEYLRLVRIELEARKQEWRERLRQAEKRWANAN